MFGFVIIVMFRLLAVFYIIPMSVRLMQIVPDVNYLRLELWHVCIAQYIEPERAFL